MNWKDFKDGCPWRYTGSQRKGRCASHYACRESDCAPYYWARKVWEVREGIVRDKEKMEPYQGRHLDDYTI